MATPQDMDVESDAEPEDSSVCRQSRRDSNDVPVTSTFNMKQKKSVKRDEKMQAIENLDANRMININDVKLRRKQFYESDILILNAEEDHDDAICLQRFIETNVKFPGPENLRPTVILLDDVITPVGVQPLDHAYSRTSCLFIYCSQHFCDSLEHKFKGNACLTGALRGKHKYIVLIHSLPRKTRDYDLGDMLNGIPNEIVHFDYNKYFVRDVESLLEQMRKNVSDTVKNDEDKKTKSERENKDSRSQHNKGKRQNAENATPPKDRTELQTRAQWNTTPSFKNESQGVQPLGSREIQSGEETKSGLPCVMQEQTTQKQPLSSIEQSVRVKERNVNRKSSFPSITTDGDDSAAESAYDSDFSSLSLNDPEMDKSFKKEMNIADISNISSNNYNSPENVKYRHLQK